MPLRTNNGKGEHKTTQMKTHLIIGTGIIGLCIARDLIIKHPEAKIVMLEKEADVALHGSGRNSGILRVG